ncbi:tetraacyldisaccharide 4'-kinase [Desulfuromonas sp. AOP6]|uniref:tetraacyldisaccharide 4'-kinase n=1 Tax=Desulfuromonas sp. AOP6 TaxID=1566351 RepID=UPI00127F654F|nr:tetraacyldisaccharide 4'-kinase [Desulfuromonas sp. AOP6]BCA80116.1 tetraacyldisaccharide 4'-kinase [Desulfuromonas sp. AOP6]
MKILSWHRRLVLQGPDGFLDLLLLGVLIPLGWLYGLVGLCRAALYRCGVLSSFRSPVPVISVGNITAGGTGKTPVVDALVKHFLSQGLRVAVVSRGYGGALQERVGVVSVGEGPQMAADLCGDEPFLLARRNPQALVFVARKRADGVRTAVERYQAERIILDDGFQHLAVQRDVDILLLDGSKPLGNGQVLPAGLLREFPSAVKRADLLVFTRCPEGSGSPSAPPLYAEKPAYYSQHLLASEAISLAGEVVPLARLQTKKGVAFAGIADPTSFFEALAAKGLLLVENLALSDHVVYDIQLVKRLSRLAEGADYLITTEKDAVKLDLGDFSVPCYQVPLAMHLFDEEGFFQKLHQIIPGRDHAPE